MEVDDELNIVKLPTFVTEVGLSVYKGPYDTMDLRRFGGGAQVSLNGHLSSMIKTEKCFL